MKTLITNDDGIRSEGIAALARTLAEDGHDVIIVAPEHNMSGMAAALGPMEMGERIPVTRMDVGGLEGYAVAAPPALGVFAASQGAFGEPPGLVVSGVNAGLNTGRSVLHSGTVGAALTAAMFGIPAVAVSVDAGEEWHFETACAVARQGLAWLADHPAAGAVLNLNVPALDRSTLKGLRWAALDRFGAVQTTGHDPGRGLAFELRSAEQLPVPGSDLALIEEGYATASVICALSAVDAGHLEPLEAPGPVSARPQPSVEVTDQAVAQDREERVLGPG